MARGRGAIAAPGSPSGRPGRRAGPVALCALLAPLWLVPTSYTPVGPGAADAPKPLGKFDSIARLDLWTLEGKRWRPSDYGGKVLIVQQWASHCAPCIREFPEAEKLAATLRSDPDVAFVTMNLDPSPSALRSFFVKVRSKFTFPIVLAGKAVRPIALPCVWIVDREGFIREEIVGGAPDWADQTIALARSVGERPSVSTLPAEVIREARARTQQRYRESSPKK